MASHYIPTAAEEAVLATKIASGDFRAVHELALGAQAWAETIVSRHLGQGVDREDLRSEAYIGLVKAAQHFDPSKGRFAAFSSLFVKGVLQDLIRSQGRPVAISERAFEGEFRARQSGEGLQSGTAAADAASWTSATSLDIPAGVQIPDVEDQERVIVERLFVDGLLNELSAVERVVITARFGLPGSTVSEDAASIAVTMGLSMRTVYKIEQRALAKLRAVGVAA